MRSSAKSLIGIAFYLSVAAHAATLPSSSLFGGVGINIAGSPTTTDFTEFPQSALIKKVPFGFASFFAVGEPSPFMEATVDFGPSIGTPLINGRSSGLLNYYVQIVSPLSLTVGVAIDVAGSVTGVASANSFDATFVMESAWELWDSPTLGVRLAHDILRPNLRSGSYHDEFSRTVLVDMETNHVYLVRLLADAQAEVRAGNSVKAVARIDPVFSFQPGVELSLVSFDFSEGIGNSPVPLPAPLVLLGASLLSLVSLLRRRQQGSAT